jgi:hypothetical protein
MALKSRTEQVVLRTESLMKLGQPAAATDPTDRTDRTDSACGGRWPVRFLSLVRSSLDRDISAVAHRLTTMLRLRSMLSMLAIGRIGPIGPFVWVASRPRAFASWIGGAPPETRTSVLSLSGGV